MLVNKVIKSSKIEKTEHKNIQLFLKEKLSNGERE